MLEIGSLYDICTRHKKSHLNVDHDSCAQTSVSGLEHRHGLERSSPVMLNKDLNFGTILAVYLFNSANLKRLT